MELARHITKSRIPAWPSGYERRLLIEWLWVQNWTIAWKDCSGYCTLKYLELACTFYNECCTWLKKNSQVATINHLSVQGGDPGHEIPWRKWFEDLWLLRNDPSNLNSRYLTLYFKQRKCKTKSFRKLLQIWTSKHVESLTEYFYCRF